MRDRCTSLLKLAIVVAVVVGMMRLAGPKLGARMERMFEDAPDDFPPKWMYLNVSAIRENTERILRLLETKEGGSEAA